MSCGPGLDNKRGALSRSSRPPYLLVADHPCGAIIQLAAAKGRVKKVVDRRKREAERPLSGSESTSFLGEIRDLPWSRRGPPVLNRNVHLDRPVIGGLADKKPASPFACHCTLRYEPG